MNPYANNNYGGDAYGNYGGGGKGGNYAGGYGDGGFNGQQSYAGGDGGSWGGDGWGANGGNGAGYSDWDSIGNGKGDAKGGKAAKGGGKSGGKGGDGWGANGGNGAGYSDWDSIGNGKGDAKGGKAAKGGGKSGGKGGGGGKSSSVCKFFLEGRCTRGDGCSFSHTPAAEGGNDDDDEDDENFREIEALIARNEAEKSDDAAMLAQLEEEQEIPKGRFFPGNDDNDSDNGDSLPPPATEAEVEEARQIFQKAEREAVIRKENKAKAATCNGADLQAMINARLAAK